MIKLRFYSAQNGAKLVPSDSMIRSVAEFLKQAAWTIKQDLEDEGVCSYESLTFAKNFLAYYEKNKEDFDGFGAFILDYQGVYDGKRYAYNWRTFQPFVDAVFRFGIKMPNKVRLIEISGNYKLPVYALDEEEVVNFVLSHFAFYAKSDFSFKDSHGRKQHILEAMYAKLQNMKKGVEFEAGSPKWALELLIKRFVYNL